MTETGRLELNIFDVHGARLTERLDILLRHHVLHEQQRATSVDAGRTVAIGNLRPEPQGLHVLEIIAPSYQPIKRFVSIRSNGVTRETITPPYPSPTRRAQYFPRSMSWMTA